METKAEERFLFADEYISERSISFWQKEAVKRRRDKEKDEAYERFINWKKQANEIAVITLYSYADFRVPRKFDVVFDFGRPDEFIQANYQLTQSVWEGWYPVNFIDRGHKHICVFSFDDKIPDLLFKMKQRDGLNEQDGDNFKKLGFCNMRDYDSIARYLEMNK